MHTTALTRAFAVFVILLFGASLIGLALTVPAGGGLTALPTAAVLWGVAAISAGMLGMIAGIIHAIRVS